MKFDFKGILKSGFVTVKDVALVTAGVIGTQKFLDFKTLMPQADPTKFYMKHEGFVKVGGVVIVLGLWKKCPPLIRMLLIGMAVQGAIKEIRQMTMNEKGEAMFTQIGAESYDDAIRQMAEEIKKDASLKGPSITDQYSTGVNGIGRGAEVMALMNNSATTVSGISGIGMSNETWEN